jgi:hypothetical protein
MLSVHVGTRRVHERLDVLKLLSYYTRSVVTWNIVESFDYLGIPILRSLDADLVLSRCLSRFWSAYRVIHGVGMHPFGLQPLSLEGIPTTAHRFLPAILAALPA